MITSQSRHRSYLTFEQILDAEKGNKAAAEARRDYAMTLGEGATRGAGMVGTWLGAVNQFPTVRNML